MCRLLLLLASSLTLDLVGGGHVLAVLPFPMYSHTVPFLPILEELATRGHQVTLVSPFSLSHERVHSIKVNYTFQDFVVGLKKRGLEIDVASITGLYYEAMGFPFCHYFSAETGEVVKPYLPKPGEVKFDLLIGEFFFCQEVYAALGHIYNIPIASKHPAPIVPIAAYMMSNPTVTPYTPHIRLALSNNMNLLERTWNFVISTYDEIRYAMSVLPTQDLNLGVAVCIKALSNRRPVGGCVVVCLRTTEKLTTLLYKLPHPDINPINRTTLSYILQYTFRLENGIFMSKTLTNSTRNTASDDGDQSKDRVMRDLFGEDLPYLGDILQNVSLLMTETHFSANYPRPFARNILEIGGMGTHVSQPIPKDIEKFLNESKSGVIYFSWGSHFEANMTETLAALMRDFSKLEQRVLFKWSHDIPGRPENVLINSWFPQNSILGHPKTVLYISHCGLNSIYEAIDHAVPVVGTPIFVDQPHNARLLQSLGMAEVVTVPQLTDGTSLLHAIKTVLSNPSYKENAAKRSAMMKDRPMPVLSEACYWLEFVMRHGGAALRPPALPWYSRWLLDVLACLTLALLMPVLLILGILRLCWRRWSRGRKGKQHSE